MQTVSLGDVGAMPVVLQRTRAFGASTGLTELSLGTSMCKEIVPAASGITPCVLFMIQVGCKNVGRSLLLCRRRE